MSAMAKSALVALVVASRSASVAADAFLQARPEQLDKEDVRHLLLSELTGRTEAAKLTAIEADIRPLFVTLPKNGQGRLDAPLVRYALHRYFVQKNGWFVKGLDAAWSHSDNSTSSSVLKARAPAYIQSLFEEQLQGRGFGLRELVAFAATLADLIHAEAVGQLEWIHQVKGLSTTSTVPRSEADSAIEAFLVAYLLGGSRVADTEADLKFMEIRLQEQYPDLPETQLWMTDFRRTYDLMQAPRRNPFVEERAPTFDDSAAFVVDFSHHFGAFQNLECHGLKRRLSDMEHQGTGRVRMADFYSNALSGGWEFMESIQYLRNQGALDETDPSRPSVVIPNYLNSLANCLTASNFYAVCCVNECNALMSHLERAIAAPTASPSRLAEIVAHLQSDTVDAPRNLSSTLLARLEQISDHHGGAIPLHGRLFAQWMHHAYPRECQFPHLSGSVSPLTPQEFAELQGVEALEANVMEMEAHASWKNETSLFSALPWVQVEEELAVHVEATRSSWRGCLGRLAALAALASFAVPMCNMLRGAFGRPTKGKVESHMV